MKIRMETNAIGNKMIESIHGTKVEISNKWIVLEEESSEIQREGWLWKDLEYGHRKEHFKNTSYEILKELKYCFKN